MSDSYKAFIRELKRCMIERNLTPQSAADYVRVCRSTFYNWLNMRTVMSGDDMIRIIDNLMDGHYRRI
jgi:predicted transcriptional regulator